MSPLIRRRSVLKALCASPALWNSGFSVAAETYPSKPVRLVVAFPPGGGTDVVARYVASNLGPKIKVPMIVENRPGSAGNIGSDHVVRSTPDGYTLAICTSSYACNAAYYDLPFDPVKDISPITKIAGGPLLAVVNPSVPIHSIKELIEHAKANPDKINYASSGNGGINHLSTEYFKLLSGIRMYHIPYKGTGPGLTDIIDGRVQLLFGDVMGTLPFVKSGKLRAIGVTTAQRISALPDVPTIMETVPGYEINNWYGFWGPAHLKVADYLNQELKPVLETTETKEWFERQGLTASPTTPARFREILVADIEKFKKIVAEARIDRNSAG